MVFLCLSEDLLSDVFGLGSWGQVGLCIEYRVFMFFYIVVILVVSLSVVVQYLLLRVNLIPSYIGYVQFLLWLFNSYPVALWVGISRTPILYSCLGLCMCFLLMSVFIVCWFCLGVCFFLSVYSTITGHKLAGVCMGIVGMWMVQQDSILTCGLGLGWLSRTICELCFVLVMSVLGFRVLYFIFV